MLNKFSNLAGAEVLSISEQKSLKGGMCQAYCPDGSPSVNCHCGYCQQLLDQNDPDVCWTVCYNADGTSSSTPHSCS